MTGSSIEISRSEARRLAVIAQGLHARAPFGRGINGLIRTVEHLGYVQIDTISVVARAHHHILFSRLPSYKPVSLKEAQNKHRRLLEYWAHAAAFIPMSNYRYTLPIQERFRSGADGWPRSDRDLMDRIVDRIRDEGPLMSRDFDSPDKRAGNWWDWKPAKRALHRLFLEGELVVSHREGFQRVFDLPERVIPNNINTSPPGEDEHHDFLIDSYLDAHGIGSSKMMSYLRRGMNAKVLSRIDRRMNEGSLIAVSIKGIQHAPLVAKPDVLDLLSKSIKQRARLLSPFDNLVIQRERLSLLFDFDYQIECYVPREKRVFGYYVLPILYGSKIVGRIDAKADRKHGLFKVLSMHLERGCDSETVTQHLQSELMEYAVFCGCNEVDWQC